MKRLIFSILFTALLKISFSQPTIGLQQYATGFSSPVDIVNCGDDRLFIVERRGYIRIIDGQGVVNPTPFLDIDAKVTNNGGEQGLLGLAFHPDYKNNGYFFVNYIDINGDTQIARFTVNSSNPNSAATSSEIQVLFIAQPYSNHNGGDLEFGPDGYLYIGMGDGGSGGDPGNRSQNGQERLGKMLRIAVDSLPYSIPPDNPFINNPNVLDEIWAIGVRNPWRFSFDRLTGDLWIADVGQNAWEEIDFQAANSNGGENYGWRCYEGNNAYNTSGCGAIGNYVFPVYEYSHSNGCSVTGGYVYRGCKYPDLFGQYIFCDYCSGRFWTIQNNGGGNFQTNNQLTSGTDYSSFGEDMNGEVYLARLNGTIYHITETTTVATLPTITANPGTSLCPGDSVTLSTQPGYAVYWELNSSTLVGIGLQINANTPGNYTLTATGNNGCVYTTPATTITTATPPTPFITASDTAFCAGDSLQLTTGNFSAYQWSDGSTASSTFAKQVGTYNLTVTDVNGCTGSSAPFPVTKNPLPVPAIQQTGNLCNGNAATLSTDSYASYSWSTLESTPQISVNQPDSYDLTVTDVNGCSGSSLPFTVFDNQLPQPLIYSSNGPAICEGDSTELFTAVTDVSYLWSTGDTESVLTVNLAGDYSVTVADSSGCIGVSDTFVLSVFPLPSPEILPGYDVKQCGDGVIELTTASAYTEYNWSRGDTTPILFVISSGTFNVTVIDANGCVGASDSAKVNFYSNPPITNIIQPSLSSSLVYAEDSGYYYQWYADGVALVGDTFQSYDWSSSFGSVYNVELSDDNRCSTLSTPYYPIIDAINETWLGNMSIQPNPFTSEMVLNYTLNDLADLKIRLIDLTGKEIGIVLNEKQGAGTYAVSINTDKLGLSDGIYFLKFQSGILRRTFKVIKM